MVLAVLAVRSSGLLMAQATRTTPRFYPDDPLATDNDSAWTRPASMKSSCRKRGTS